MRLQTVVLSGLYSISQATLGLLLHPYQTVQLLLKEKVFLWILFLPVVIAVGVGILWWEILKHLFIFFPYIGIWIFSFLWIELFLGFWQLLLFYLLIRFWVSLR